MHVVGSIRQKKFKSTNFIFAKLATHSSIQFDNNSSESLRWPNKWLATYTADGYTVVFCDINEEKGQTVADKYGARFVKVDVTQADD